MSRKPIAVLTADVHYNSATKEVADNAMADIIAYAEANYLPVIVAGDLHDTKRHMYGDVVGTMIKRFSRSDVDIYITIGNHCRINEHSPEHSLEFLKPYCNVLNTPTFVEELSLYLIPYYQDIVALKALLASIKPGSTLIMHQGIQGSNAGHYIQDKTALNKADFAPFRIASGHYHERQTIDTGKGNKFDYIGNPFSLNFGEANQGQKGFQVLFNDGSLEFHPLSLRRHIVLELDVSALPKTKWSTEPENLVWIKLKGTHSELAGIKKEDVAKQFGLKNFKLDKIPTDAGVITYKSDSMNDHELLDKLIDTSGESDSQKKYLKNLWKELI